MTDRRLLVPAAAAWAASAGAGQALAVGATPGLVGGVAAAVAATALLALVGLRAGGRRPSGAALVVTLAATGLALAGAAAHAASLRAEPLAAWSGAGATATVVGTVEVEPVSRPTPWGSPGHQTVVRTATVSARGEVVAVEVPLLVTSAGALPPPGSRVEVVGRLAPGGARAASVLRAVRLTVIAPPGPVAAAAQAMRDGLRASLTGAPPDAGSLVAGLAIGDDSAQPAGLAEAMKRSGLAHLTAVSGSNVSIVVVAATLVAAVLGLGSVGRCLVALAAVAYFVVVVGPQPSVLRAAVMGGIVTLGTLVGGRRAGPSVLSVSVIALVVVSPPLAVSAGFALSVLATAALVLLAPPLGRWLASTWWAGRWPAVLRDALAVTLAAQAGTLPILVLMGAAVGWVAVPANLLAMPAVAPVTILGLLAAAAAPWWPSGGELLAGVAAVPAGWIATVARAAAVAPATGLPTGPVGAAVVVLGVAVLVVRAPRTRLLLVAGAAVLGGLGAVLPRSWPPPGWLVLMCDVGQGSATLLRTGPAEAVLVDTGPDPDAVDRCLADAGVSSLPAIVLTHYHQDHVAGLSGALRGRPVGQVLATPIRDPPELAAAVDAVLAGSGLAVEPVTAGDARTVGPLAWRTLWPRRDLGDGPNNASLVLEATLEGRRILLTGDVERAAQAAVRPDLGDVDVATVPHHGSGDLLPGFAAATGAEVALVSVGVDNPFGHPHEAALREWAAMRLARTDRHGDVAVVADGQGLAVVVRRGMLPP